MSKLTEKDIAAITEEFYSRFACTDLSGVTDGIHFVCDAARSKAVQGFGHRYTVFLLQKGNACIVTYAPQYAAFFHVLKSNRVQDILSAVEHAFTVKKTQLMQFRKELISDYGAARLLKKDDYPAYETFFRRCSPAADPTGWLQEYFEEKSAKEYFAGYFVNDALVCVCDAPDMPHMADRIQHTGIITLPEERRKGYARCTAALATNHLLEIGVCPQWECSAANTASIALAKSIGYETYGFAYIHEE